MAKRKYYEIEKDSSEEEIKEKSKRAKTRESDVSDRTATLSIKKKKAQEFQKIKSREQKKKETAAKNLNYIMDRGDSSEKIIECGARDSDSSGKNIFKKKDESGLIRISSIQENQENSLDNKNIFDTTEDIVVISESECSSDVSFQNEFSTSILDLFNLNKIQGDGNCLFRALCKSTFGNESMHLEVRQYVWDYMIEHRERFSEFIENDISIDEYLSKMLLDGEWGGHAELVAFSEIYNVSIQVFDSIGSKDPIIRILTTDGAIMISILFSGDHYDSLTPKNQFEDNIERGYETSKSEWYKKAPSNLNILTREYHFASDYSTKYSDKTLKSIFEYLKNNKYPEAIENLRKNKNELTQSKEATKEEKEKSRKIFEAAKRHYRSMIQSGIRFKLVQHEFLGKKYETLSRNWFSNKLENKNTQHVKNRQEEDKPKRRSKSIDIINSNPINEWLIIPYEWQVPIIIYDCHTKSRSHLRIQPTYNEIINAGYKWENMQNDVREFVLKCQIW